MDVTYGDDVAYIRLGEGKVARSAEVAPGVLIDLDEAGEAVGLEVLGLRRRGLVSGRVIAHVAAKLPGHASDERRLGQLLSARRKAQAS